MEQTIELTGNEGGAALCAHDISTELTIVGEVSLAVEARAWSAPAAPRAPINAMAERQFQDLGEEVIAALLQRAVDGNTSAAKICFDRMLPAPRDRVISIDLRPITCTEDAIGALSDILAAVAQGRITPSEATAVSKLLQNFIEAHTLRDFERRIKALEAASEIH